VSIDFRPRAQCFDCEGTCPALRKRYAGRVARGSDANKHRQPGCGGFVTRSCFVMLSAWPCEAVRSLHAYLDAACLGGITAAGSFHRFLQDDAVRRNAGGRQRVPHIHGAILRELIVVSRVAGRIVVAGDYSLCPGVRSQKIDYRGERLVCVRAPKTNHQKQQLNAPIFRSRFSFR